MIKKVKRKSSGAAAKKKVSRGKTPAGKKVRATPVKKKAPAGKKVRTTPVKKKASAGKKVRATPVKKKAPAGKKIRATSVKKKAPAGKKARSAGARMTVHRDNAALSDITPYKKQQGEEYMNRKQLDHFQKILINWKESLMQEVDRTVTHMQADSANHADSADRATQEEGFSLELRERDRERKLIRKIDQALSRLDNSDFGYCKLCGVEIGIRRLEARPTATMCIDCKTFDEIKEKQIAAV